MTNFKELIESQTFAIGMLCRIISLTQDKIPRKELRLHHARLIGIRSILYLRSITQTTKMPPLMLN